MRVLESKIIEINPTTGEMLMYQKLLQESIVMDVLELLI